MAGSGCLYERAAQDLKGKITGIWTDANEWEVLKSETHDRLQNGPDGQPTHRTDSTVKVRRLPQ